MNHIISWSGGKDSTATIILFRQHEKELLKPGDKVIICFAEVMFDLKNNISGHNPEIIKFIHKTANTFRSWNYEVRFLRADKDFLDFFHHRMKNCRTHPEHEGMTFGFPASGICGIKRDLKLKPISNFKKEMEKTEYVEYIGIAADETARLTAMHKTQNSISLLEQYDISENDARQLCTDYNMLSPQYSMIQENGKHQNRDGCWFCPNAKLCEHKAIKQAYPDAWKQYVSLENEPNLAFPKWNPYTKETLHERDKRIDQEE